MIYSIVSRDLILENEEGLGPETVDLDEGDLAGWSSEIFGKK